VSLTLCSAVSQGLKRLSPSMMHTLRFSHRSRQQCTGTLLPSSQSGQKELQRSHLREIRYKLPSIRSTFPEMRVDVASRVRFAADDSLRSATSAFHDQFRAERGSPVNARLLRTCERSITYSSYCAYVTKKEVRGDYVVTGHAAKHSSRGKRQEHRIR
jgi:hypothetical protein